MAGAGRRHLEDTGMDYGAHLGRAWKIGGALMAAGGACFVHGLFPSLFSDKASRTIIRLHEDVKKTAHHGAARSEPVLLEFEI
jgi:hypothetical protein